MASSPSLSRLSLAAAWLAIVLGSGACSNPPDCGKGCPKATGHTRIVRGTVTRVVGAEAPRTQAIVESASTPSSDACTMSGLDVEVFGNEFVNGTGPMLSCDASAHGFYSMLFTKAGDPRDWVVGTRSLTGADVGLLFEICLPGGGRGCVMCRGNLDDVVVTITVEEATGGKAAYPRLVTADYKRVWRVELDTGTRPTVPVESGGCPTVASKVSLRYEQSAADWTFDASAPCMCE